jgi:hypothetical protein
MPYPRELGKVLFFFLKSFQCLSWAFAHTDTAIPSYEEAQGKALISPPGDIFRPTLTQGSMIYNDKEVHILYFLGAFWWQVAKIQCALT